MRAGGAWSGLLTRSVRRGDQCVLDRRDADNVISATELVKRRERQDKLDRQVGFAHREIELDETIGAHLSQPNEARAGIERFRRRKGLLMRAHSNGLLAVRDLATRHRAFGSLRGDTAWSKNVSANAIHRVSFESSIRALPDA